MNENKPSLSEKEQMFQYMHWDIFLDSTVSRFLQDNQDSFDLVEWVLFDSHTEAVYEAEVERSYGTENRVFM